VSNRLNRVFRLAAKRYATSYTLWLISAPFLIFGLIFTELSVDWSANAVAAVLIAGALSHLAIGLVLWLGGKTVLRPARREAAGWIQVLAVFVLAGLARGITIGLVIEALEVGQAALPTRMTTAVVLVVFSFTFFLYSAQLWSDYRARRFQLLYSIAVGERTDALRDLASAQLRPLRLLDIEEDVLRARDQTKSALQSIRERVRSNQIDSLDVQDAFEVSDGNWRDLSHRAWIASVPNVPKVNVREIAKTLASSKPFSLILLSSGPAYGVTRTFESLGLPTALSAGLTWWLGVVAIAIATNFFAAKFRGLGLQVLVAGFLAIQCWAFLTGIWFMKGAATTEIIFVSLVSSISAIGLGLPPAIEREGQLVLQKLERRLDNSAIENLKAQGEMFVLAQRIGGYLHSEVRGDFLRHSMALREALESGDLAAAEKVLDQLDHLVGEINLEESEHSPIENLAAFLKNWNGVIRISHNLAAITIAQPIQRNVEVVVMEAVNNAVRHGHASWVNISFTQTGDEVELQIDSDSQFFAESSTQGIGTQTLNRLAEGRWSRQKIEAPDEPPILRLTVKFSSEVTKIY